mmetsp:Transcript_3527/g.2115  ORF Transcript_3527/g.2115 Transcript_3527/m.2115 type:complete len:308 (-) Transcript_3527:473-1396(-)
MIEVKNITKYFGANKAVDNISFTVNKGEILGFLGPNGAGKSTTMRIITGFIQPSEGNVFIGNHNVISAPTSARAKFGYLPENAPVYPNMIVKGYLEFCAEIRGFKGSMKKQKAEYSIHKCFLEEVKHQRIDTLSKGFKQRVCFAQSIIHDPEYLILDEPTDGLDPNQKHEVRHMIKNMSQNKAIILSTHILDEVDAVCTRVIIMANGRIVADDTPDNLKTGSPMHGVVSISIVHDEPEKIISVIQHMDGVKSTKIVSKNKISVFPTQKAVLQLDHILSALRKNKCEINSIFIQRGRLDEVFRKITTE